MKRCFKCGEVKSRAEFYRHAAMSDGLLGKCKYCTRADSTARRLQKLEEIREYDRSRSHLSHRIKARAEYTKFARKMSPEKSRAHVKVWRAVNSGLLKKLPCAVCGNPKTEAHHPDYSKPLEVTWLCKPHHYLADQERRSHAA